MEENDLTYDLLLAEAKRNVSPIPVKPPRWWQVFQNRSLTCQRAGASAEAICHKRHRRELEAIRNEGFNLHKSVLLLTFCLTIFILFFLASYSLWASLIGLLLFWVGLFVQTTHRFALKTWDAHTADRRERNKTPEAVEFHLVLDHLFSLLRTPVVLFSFRVVVRDSKDEEIDSALKRLNNRVAYEAGLLRGIVNAFRNSLDNAALFEPDRTRERMVDLAIRIRNQLEALAVVKQSANATMRNLNPETPPSIIQEMVNREIMRLNRQSPENNS